MRPAEAVEGLGVGICRLIRASVPLRSSLALGRRSPAGLVLEIEIHERLSGGRLHDEARVVVLLDHPGRWEGSAGAALRAISLSAQQRPPHICCDSGVSG